MTIADATVRSQLYKLSVLKDRHEAHVIQVITEFIVGNVNVICKRTRKYERLCIEFQFLGLPCYLLKNLTVFQSAGKAPPN